MSKKMTLEAAQNAISSIARSHGVTEAEVRAEMESAILAGYNDPSVRDEWEKTPFSGRLPSAEEFIMWCAERL